MLTHKVATRIARFDEALFDARDRIYENIRDFYNLRSLILHGENVEEKKSKDRKLRKYLENDGLAKSISHIRKAIRSYIQAAMEFNQDPDQFLDDHKKFIKKLDLG